MLFPSFCHSNNSQKVIRVSRLENQRSLFGATPSLPWQTAGWGLPRTSSPRDPGNQPQLGKALAALVRSKQSPGPAAIPVPFCRYFSYSPPAPLFCFQQSRPARAFQSISYSPYNFVTSLFSVLLRSPVFLPGESSTICAVLVTAKRTHHHSSPLRCHIPILSTL